MRPYKNSFLGYQKWTDKFDTSKRSYNRFTRPKEDKIRLLTVVQPGRQPGLGMFEHLSGQYITYNVPLNPIVTWDDSIWGTVTLAVTDGTHEVQIKLPHVSNYRLFGKVVNHVAVSPDVEVFFEGTGVPEDE